MKYIAVFKSLVYAQRLQNKFKQSKLPLITKTPKSLAGGCSYSLEFLDDMLDDVIKFTSNNQKGFIGIYRETPKNNYEKINIWNEVN